MLNLRSFFLLFKFKMFVEHCQYFELNKQLKRRIKYKHTNLKYLKKCIDKI